MTEEAIPRDPSISRKKRRRILERCSGGGGFHERDPRHLLVWLLTSVERAWFHRHWYQNPLSWALLSLSLSKRTPLFFIYAVTIILPFSNGNLRDRELQTELELLNKREFRRISKRGVAWNKLYEKWRGDFRKLLSLSSHLSTVRSSFRACFLYKPQNSSVHVSHICIGRERFLIERRRSDRRKTFEREFQGVANYSARNSPRKFVDIIVILISYRWERRKYTC